MLGSSQASQSSPVIPPPSLKKSTSSSGKNQKTILGFFQKKSTAPNGLSDDSPKVMERHLVQSNAGKSSSARFTLRGSSQSLTPAPSSDIFDGAENPKSFEIDMQMHDEATGLPSPTSANGTPSGNGSIPTVSSFHSPSRKVGVIIPEFLNFKLIVPSQVKKTINYAESGAEEDEEDGFEPAQPVKPSGRRLKRRKVAHISDEEDFAHDSEAEAAMLDQGILLTVISTRTFGAS